MLVGLCLLGSPAIAQQGVEVRDEAERLLLRTEAVTIVLSKAEKGGIVSVTDNATGQEFIAKQKEPCLFRLVFTKKGDVSGATETFSSRDAQEMKCLVAKDGMKTVATLDFKGIGGKRIDATCKVSVSKGDPLVRWRISVSGQEPLVLEEVHFPILVLSAKLGDSDEDDAAVSGLFNGGVYRRPGQWTVGTRVWDKQPGTLQAQFACYYDARAGLHTATQDSKGYPKQFEMVRTTDGVGFIWKHLCFHELTKPLALDYDVVCTTYRSKEEGVPTDWHDGADIYKEWAMKQPWCARTIAERKDIPEFIKSAPVIVSFDRRTGGGATPRISFWLDRYWGKFFSPKASLIAMFYSWEHVAAWVSPKYFPFYPSDEDFAEAVRIIRKYGGHIFLWPSTYQWTLTYGERPDGTYEWDDRADFEKVGRAHAVVNRDGSLFTRKFDWLKGGESANLCHGDPFTLQWFTEIVDGLVKCGADLIQLDQAVGGGWPLGVPQTCFSSTHGHPPGYGLWQTDAFHKQLRMLRHRFPQVGFDFEGNQELFIQDGNGIWDYRDDEIFFQPRASGHEPASVFTYLYHEFCPSFNHHAGYAGPLAPVLLAYSLVNGQVPWIGPYAFTGEGHAVLNGDFEAFDNPAQPPMGWEHVSKGSSGVSYDGKFYRDEQVKHSGRYGLRLENETEKQIVQISQNVPVDGKTLSIGRTYRLKLWLRSTGVAGQNNVMIGAYDEGWKEKGSWRIPIPSETDWVRKQVEMTIPDGSVRLRIMLHLEGKGKVWVDDIEIVELGEGGQERPVRRPMPARDKILQQWVKIWSEEGKPYLLFGRMLHPPTLECERVKLDFIGYRGVGSPISLSTYVSAPGSTYTGDWSIPVPPNTDWVKQSLIFTVPEGSQSALLKLHLETKGTLWFDDFSLTELGSDTNLLPNGDLEDWADPSSAPNGWSHVKEYGGQQWTGKVFRDEKEKYSGKYAIRLENQTDKDIVHVHCPLSSGDGKPLVVGKTYKLTFWMKSRDVNQTRHVHTVRSLPAIFHNAYRAPDGSEAVIAVNITDQPQTGRLRWHGKDIELKLSPWEAILLKERVNVEGRAGQRLR